MNNAAQIDTAAVLQWEYKTGAMREMLVHVLRLALRGNEFTANDLPVHGEAGHGGSGVAGTVIHRLAREGILVPVGVFAGADFIPRTVRNQGGNKIGVWRLANSSLARTLLNRHADSSPKPTQLSLFNAAI